MTIQLRGGATTEDRRLDRLVHFDEASRGFPIRALFGAEPRQPRGYTWDCPLWLNQGREGACVGFSLSHELAARPAKVPNLDNRFAIEVYRAAQKIDPWAGEDYDGTSVLAGVKILHKAGWFGSYRWAFGEYDLRLGIGYNGPAVIGVNWYDGMYDPDERGYLRPTGRIVGGHAILVRGFSVRYDRYLVHNSWGKSWGNNATAYIASKDMARLLQEDGEAVFMLNRKVAV